MVGVGGGVILHSQVGGGFLGRRNSLQNIIGNVNGGLLIKGGRKKNPPRSEAIPSSTEGGVKGPAHRVKPFQW